MENVSVTNGAPSTLGVKIAVSNWGDLADVSDSKEKITTSAYDKQHGTLAAQAVVKIEVCDDDVVEQAMCACDVCGKECQGHSGLNLHKHEFRCHTCNRVFNNSGAFHTHMKSHIRNIRTGELRKKEINSCTGEFDQFDCDICQQKCVSMKALYLHRQVHRGDNSPFKCPMCDRILINKAAFQMHVKSHVRDADVGEVEYRCPLCSEDFKDDESLERHECAHIDKAQLRVNFGESFCIKEQAQDDLEPANAEDGSDQNAYKKESSYTCSLCSKTFVSQIELTDHRKINHLEKPYTCSECGHMFTKKWYFENHMRIHLDHESFKCPLCGKTFKLKSYFHKHMKCHTVEKNHKCSICGQHFKIRGYLLKHMKKHHAIDNPHNFELEISSEIDTLKEEDIFADKNVESCSGETETFEQLIDSLPKNGKSNECKICNKVIARSKDLRRHMKIHYGEKHKCNLCGKMIARTDNLLQHKRLFHKDSINNNLLEDREKGDIYECKLCNQSFEMRTLYDRHLKNHEEEGNMKFECEMCGKQFVDAAYLRQHMIRHAKDRPYQCTVCGRAFSRITSYRRHMQSHPGAIERPHGCTICSKSFDKAYALSAHLLIHNKVRTYKCQKCNKAFYTSSCLRKHVKTHSITKSFPCHVCGKAFKLQKCAILHLMMHKGERPHKCPICSENFELKFQLSKHMMVHELEEMCEKKPYPTNNNNNMHIPREISLISGKSKVCKICKKVMASGKSLTRHMRTHSGEKYRCDFCDKTFARIYILKSHMRLIHKQILVNPKEGIEGDIVRHGVSKKVLFKCPACGLLFIHRNELATHIRIHTGQKPYECSFCAESFNGRSHMQEHMNSHHLDLGAKCNMCSFCGKGFRKTSDFQRHMLIHSGEKPYRCMQCGHAFVRKDSLNAHVRRKHCVHQGP